MIALQTDRPRQRGRNGRSGFTLIELLLVLAILVVLASMVVTMFSGTQERALKDAAKGQVGIFKSAVNLYKFHTRSYPNDLSGLISKPSDANTASRWNGPYLDSPKVPADPWDRDYRFAAPGKHNPETFDVWSVGPDGQDGTDDDIGNWE
ncbi:MAG TPA: type II secretion system major pseudopilin GspG [Lacipirellulaceae bacterium]|jgi:general secretion pathway protein G|nr:type II secretion system major pseudopilin GspG [Lacipirellulaceae bacterium]